MKAIAALIVVSLFSSFGQTQISEPLVQKIDTLFKTVDSTTPGYMIAVVKGDEFLFQKGYGLANMEYEMPINSNTSFNIASLSKQITAAAIALLIQKKKYISTT